MKFQESLKESLNLPRSVLGRLSLTISYIMIVLDWLLLSNVLPAFDPKIFVPLLYRGLPLLTLIGMISGMVGLLERKRNKLHAALGFLLNIITFLPVLFFWVLGLMAGLLPSICMLDPSHCY
jgi:hypothetical protein